MQGPMAPLCFQNLSYWQCKPDIQRSSVVISVFRFVFRRSLLCLFMICGQILQEKYRYLAVCSKLTKLVGLKTINPASSSSGRSSNDIDENMRSLSPFRGKVPSKMHHYWSQFVEMVRRRLVDKLREDRAAERQELIRNVSEHVESKQKHDKLINDVFLSGKLLFRVDFLLS